MMVIKLIARSALFVSVVMLSGCASQKTWVHSGDVNTSVFNADKEYCNSLATGSVGYRPPPVYSQAPIVSPTAYNINCNQYGYSANCNVRADQSAQLMADIRTQSENAGAQIGHGLAMLADSIKAQQTYYECMKSKGYEQLSNDELDAWKFKINNSRSRWDENLKRITEKSKLLCLQDKYQDYYKKTACHSNDITLEQLSDNSYTTEVEKSKLLEIDGHLKAIDDERLQAANDLEPRGFREKIVEFLRENRIIFRDLRQNLYSGKITWGEFNKKRVELLNSRGEAYRKILSNK